MKLRNNMEMVKMNLNMRNMIMTVFMGAISILSPAPGLAGEAKGADTNAAVSGKKLTIGLIGDSTVAEESGWGPAFASQVNDRAKVVNYAKNGATLESLSGRLDDLLKLKPDYVLVQFGHNDQKRYNTEVYSTKLTSYIERIIKAGGKPVILSSVVRRSFDKDGKIVCNLIKTEACTYYDTLTGYAKAAQAVAGKSNVSFVDLHAISMSHHNSIGREASMAYNFKEGDKTHFNRKGAEAIAELIRPALAKAVPELSAVLKPMKKQPDLSETEDNEYSADVPTPTHAGVSYGSHERNILDFWQAKSDQPTPLVFVIHGGGWMGGSKERLSRFVDSNALLKAGISVAAINYRLMKHAEGVVPPVKAPLHDASRALQFLRSKAGEWNIDKSRIGAAGGSAGACSSLWLAYHDDLSDPKSQDPVARESTRLQCAGVMGPQTSLDPQQMKEWTPNSTYGGHAFGKKDFAEFLADREKILPWITEYSPYALATKDDPPVALFYNSAPALGKDQKDPTHSANFGIGLQQRCRGVGIDCDLVYPGAPGVKHQTPTDYLIAKLGGKQHDAD
jgi:acetyl esterase/lipase